MKKETDKMQPSTLFEGMVSIRPLLQDTAKRKIIKLWIDQTKYEKKSKEIRFLEHQSEQLGFSIETLNPEELQAMALGTSHGGIIASCTQRTLPALRLADIESNGFYVYLEGIEDPYNFGYALRSLYAAGVTGVVVSERNWMSAAGVVCRASAGASERFDLYEADPTAAAALFRRAGYQIYRHRISKCAKRLSNCAAKAPFPHHWRRKTGHFQGGVREMRPVSEN